MNYIEIKVWMLRKGIKREDLAAAAGVSPFTVTMTLQNKRFRSYLKVKRALRKLGCPIGLLGKGKRNKVHRLEACATKAKATG